MRLEHAGGAVPTTLRDPLTDVALEPFDLDAAVGWPDGTVGPFFIVIDRGLVAEEKILVQSRDGVELTPITRGADNTPASPHSAGAIVEHVFTAVEADEANAHIEASDGVHGVPPGEVVATESYVAGQVTADRPSDYSDLERGVGTPADPSLLTTIHGIPYPDLTDPLQVQRAFELLAAKLDEVTPVITSGSAAPPDPAGQAEGAIYLRLDV